MTRMLGVALVVGVAVGGCTGGSDATEGTSSEPVSTSVAPASVEIPPVTRPLDVSAFGTDPCALLDGSQRGELGLPAATQGGDASDATCDLSADAEHQDRSRYLRLVVFEDVGLEDQYAQCSTVDCSQWSVTEVDGYPVVRATDEMIAKYGSCKLLLGVADDASVAVIDVDVDTSADGPDCERADRAAGMVLATLR